MLTSFARGAWDKDRFEQITSTHTDGRVPFLQEDDCIVNDIAARDPVSWQYISILGREELSAPVVLETVCSFDKYGAPLIVLSDDIRRTQDDYPLYGHHFEIVAFEEGLNVWDLGDSLHQKAGMARFPVPAGEKLTLTAQIRPRQMIVTLCGVRSVFDIPDLPLRFRAGITACEGINRFYSFETRPILG